MNTRFLTGAMFLIASQAVSAAWTYDGVSFAVGRDEAGHDYTSINLRGSSTDSCLPVYADGHSNSKLLTAEFTLSPDPKGDPCITGDHDWQYAVRLYWSDPGDRYDVTVLVDGSRFAEFDLAIDQAQRMTAAKAASIPGLKPSEGMWWSSEKPGTGLAFNMDTEGRWFAALYLYDEDGEPTFLTLQGDSLAYDLEAGALEPYAVGISPVIHSAGGQCLECPWTQATATDTQKDARLLFWDRNRAKLTIGDWSLDLRLLPEASTSSSNAAAPIVGQYYALTIDGDAGRHMAIVRGIPGTGAIVTGQQHNALECVECRTVGDDGEASIQIDDALSKLVTDMQFLCTGSNCNVSVRGSTGRTYIDRTGGIISAIIGDDANASTHVELRKLTDDWRD